MLSAFKIQPAACDLVDNFGVIAWIHSLCHKRYLIYAMVGAHNVCHTYSSY